MLSSEVSASVHLALFHCFYFYLGCVCSLEEYGRMIFSDISFSLQTSTVNQSLKEIAFTDVSATPSGKMLDLMYSSVILPEFLSKVLQLECPPCYR